MPTDNDYHLASFPYAPCVFNWQCDDCIYEAWERMTYGGAIARYCDIVPFNFYTEIAGQKVSRPYAPR